MWMGKKGKGEFRGRWSSGGSVLLYLTSICLWKFLIAKGLSGNACSKELLCTYPLGAVCEVPGTRTSEEEK